MSDLILVPCPTCDGGGLITDLKYPDVDCPECEGAGWLLIEGAPINLEDLERMAPWADAPVGRPLESGEVDGLA